MTEARPGELSRAVLRDGSAPVRPVQIAREVLRDGGAGARVAQFYRTILRMRRDSPYPHFPVRLFCPPSLSARIEGGAVGGPPSLAQEQAIEAMDSGGRWVMEFGEAPLWTREMVLAWRDFTAAADEGAMNLIIPLWDRRYQPYAATAFQGSTTFGEIIWRDTPLWEADEVQASLTATASRHATSISFSFTGGDLAGGEHFSIYGPRYGWRLYRIIRVTGDLAGVKTCEIRPPLREWAATGQALNFDSPRCTMRAEGDISEIVDLLRLGRGTARFVESFNRYP